MRHISTPNFGLGIHLWDLLWSTLGPPGTGLGSLRTTRDPLKPSCEHLGPQIDQSGTGMGYLGPLWTDLGILGTTWDGAGSTCTPCDATWESYGPTWEHWGPLGTELEALGTPLADLVVLGSPRD